MTKYYRLNPGTALLYCFAVADDTTITMQKGMLLKEQGSFVLKEYPTAKIEMVEDVDNLEITKGPGKLTVIHGNEVFRLKFNVEKELYVNWINQYGYTKSVRIPDDQNLTDSKLLLAIQYTLVSSPDIKYWFYETTKSPFEIGNIYVGGEKEFAVWFNDLKPESKSDMKVYIRDTFSEIAQEHNSVQSTLKKG